MSGTRHPPLKPANSGNPPEPASFSLPKHKRVSTNWACEECRRRKSRCDGARPVCRACSSKDLQCTYTKEPRIHVLGSLKSENLVLEKDLSDAFEILSYLKTAPSDEANKVLDQIRAGTGSTISLDSGRKRIRIDDGVLSSLAMSSPSAWSSSPSSPQQSLPTFAQLQAVINQEENDGGSKLSPIAVAHPSHSPSGSDSAPTAVTERSWSQSNATSQDDFVWANVESVLLFTLPKAAIFQETIQVCIDRMGPLFWVVSPDIAKKIYEHVFHNSRDKVTAAGLAQLLGMAAVGSIFAPERISSALAETFYNISKVMLDNAIHESPVAGIRLCALLMMYNVFNRATVALAYIEMGLLLTRNYGLESPYRPRNVSDQEWTDTRRIWRTLIQAKGWLSESLGSVPTTDWDHARLMLDLSADHDSEISLEDRIQIEMTKIAVVKAKMSRTMFQSDQLTLDSVQSSKEDLRLWYERFPQALRMSRLMEMDLSQDPRKLVYYVHLLHLSGIMLLNRRLLLYLTDTTKAAANEQMALCEEAALALEESYAAAKVASRILHLLSVEDSIFHKCWIAVFHAYIACITILYELARKTINRRNKQEWEDDFICASKSLEVLSFCGEQDPVAKGLRDSAQVYFDRLKAIAYGSDSPIYDNGSEASASTSSTYTTPGAGHAWPGVDVADLPPDVFAQRFLNTVGNTPMHECARDLLGLLCHPFGNNPELKDRPDPGLKPWSEQMTCPVYFGLFLSEAEQERGAWRGFEEGLWKIMNQRS